MVMFVFRVSLCVVARFGYKQRHLFLGQRPSINHEKKHDKNQRNKKKRDIEILWVLDGRDRGCFHYLKDAAVIGRCPTCDITLNDKSISRQHLQINKKSAHWFLTDLSSTNGSWLNNKRFFYGRIHHGDLLEVGETVLLFISVQSKYFTAQKISLNSGDIRKLVFSR